VRARVQAGSRLWTDDWHGDTNLDADHRQVRDPGPDRRTPSTYTTCSPAATPYLATSNAYCTGCTRTLRTGPCNRTWTRSRSDSTTARSWARPSRKRCTGS
jgi:hypothetical protein